MTTWSWINRLYPSCISEARKDLRLGDRSTRLTIQRRACKLPPQLIEKTVDNLKLLCPDTDGGGKDWLKLKDMHFPLERAASPKDPSHTMYLREFIYFPESLLGSIEDYEAPPRHWRNVYKDRRNPTTF